MKIEKNERLTQLFGFYGILLTDIQQQYFNDYYFNDLSLAEIAENNDVSRQAVFLNLKRTVKLLEDYEQKLQLADLYQIIDTGLDNLLNNILAQDMEQAENNVRQLKKTIEEN